MRHLIRSILASTLLLSLGAIAHAEDAKPIAPTAAEAKPLKAGEKAPEVVVRDLMGKEVALKDVYAESPTALIFYRGGWCPYCSKHLASLKEAEAGLKELGFKIVALSTDLPAGGLDTQKQTGVAYTLFSDSKVEAARAFGVAFQMDAATVAKYRVYGIKLDETTGESHNVLPVPSVFLIDKAGVIQFAQSNPDYEERISNEDLLKAAKEVASKP
jgi:peroxiredoxin